MQVPDVCRITYSDIDLNGKVGDSISNANGDDISAKYVGNMHVSKCNNKGEVVNKLVIKNVIVVPDDKYNLLSISKRLN